MPRSAPRVPRNPTGEAPRKKTPSRARGRDTDIDPTQTVLDALPAAVAHLGPDGRIKLTNRLWRSLGAHGPLRGPGYHVGTNYLVACRKAAFPPGAAKVADGLVQVLGGAAPAFDFEFPGDPEGLKWFRLVATPAGDGAVVALMEVTDRHRREQDARLREDVLTHAQEIAHLGQWDMDLGTGILRWSAETHRIFGLEPGTFEGTYEAFLARLHPEDQDWTDTDRRKALREGKVLERDYRLVRPDGSFRWVHEWGEAELGPTGKPVRLSGVVLDITERRRAELRLERLQRLYAMQSRINEAIVMARTPDELFRLSCSAAIREGGLRMAFIARLDPGTGALEPAASEGHVEGYLDGLRITTDDSPHAHGPMGTALRTGQLAGSPDIAVDPHMAPWREAALARGYRSAAAIPLLVDGQSVGAMSLFSGEPGYFQEEERQLLVAVGENLSYALATMAHRARQKASEAALRQSEERFAAAFDHAAGGIALVGLDGRLLKVNRGFGDLLGYEPEELERLRFQNITHPEDLKRDQGGFQEVVRGKRPSYQARKRYLKKDGSVLWAQISTALVRDAEGAPLHCITQIQDLTEQELAIADLARLRRQSDLILASVADGIHGIDREGRILFENPAAVEMLGWAKEESGV